jgi:hypothetical protein
MSAPASHEHRATHERPTAYDVASSHERAATGEAAGTCEIAKSPKIRVLTLRANARHLAREETLAVTQTEPILTEAIASIQDILGADLDRITVERAVWACSLPG